MLKKNFNGNCKNENGKLKCKNVEQSDSGKYKCISNTTDYQMRSQTVQINVLPSENYMLRVQLLSNKLAFTSNEDIYQVCTVMWTHINPNSLKVTWRTPSGKIIFPTNGTSIGTYFSRLDPLIVVSELKIKASGATESGEYECRAEVGYRRNFASFHVKPGSDKSNVLKYTKPTQKEQSQILTTTVGIHGQKQSIQTLKQVKVFLPEREYVMECFTNRSREEYPKFEWFHNDKPLVSDSNLQAFSNELILKDVKFDLNGDYVSCRSYLDEEVFNEFIWPIRVVGIKTRGFYAKVNSQYVKKRDGDSLELNCFAVRKVSFLFC